MECREAAAAVAEEDEGRRMVAIEFQAAEALAAMARCPAGGGGASSSVELRPQQSGEAVVTSQQDEPVAAEPDTDASLETAVIVEIVPTQLCSTSRPPDPSMKFKRKLTEAEREERKLRRVMANRESARQTIRRRQAMHLELTKKADDVLEENENLKKQKELMMVKYNSLKGRNDFLKAQLSIAKKAAAGEIDEQRNSPEAERFCSATASTQGFQNQPSIAPCLWPFVVPSSDAFPFQCASHPHNMNSSHFPPGEGQSSLGTPLFVVPVPWLLPLLTQSSSTGHTHRCGKCSCSCSGTNQSGDNNINVVPSSHNMRADAYNPIETVSADGVGRAGTSGAQCNIGETPNTIIVPGMFSPVRPRETGEPSRSCQVDGSNDLRLVSALETMKPVTRSPRKAEAVFAAAEVRRRRKQLMKLKNIMQR